jgi:glycerophosphoryl diester phosphodiesterase
MGTKPLPRRAARLAAAIAVAACLVGCAVPLDLQGHRGARGLAPENTLAAFDTALALGVTTLELDTLLTLDDVVVIAHDAHGLLECATGVGRQRRRSALDGGFETGRTRLGSRAREGSRRGDWSPFHGDVDAPVMAQASQLGLQVIVWTVNEPADIAKMLDLGVHGIISDRPDRVRAALAARGWRVPPPVPEARP